MKNDYGNDIYSLSDLRADIALKVLGDIHIHFLEIDYYPVDEIRLKHLVREANHYTYYEDGEIFE